MAIIKKKERGGTTKVSEDVKRREHFYTVGGIGNWYTHEAKEYGGLSIIKNRITI